MLADLVAALRSLRACPAGAIARAAAGLPARSLAVPADLAGLREPWSPEGATGPGGATWMPVLGRVPWEEDPGPERDRLRRWSRDRLRDVLHAATLARDEGDAASALYADRRLRAFLRRAERDGEPWRSGMEVGLRAMRLLHAASRLKRARDSGCDVPPSDAFAGALARHEAVLQSRTDWRLHYTGNHYLVALAARVVLGASLPACDERARRLRRDLRLFWRELDRQVGPGGVHFESSTHYHLLAAECAAHVAAVSRSEAGPALLAMAHHAMPALLRPDGTIASVGDGDDESFVPASLGPDAPPPLRALEIAQALQGPARPVEDAGPWPGGGGLDVLRCGRLHLTVSSVRKGRAGTGGHFHDDAGSYELWLDGPLVVHRGTGAYEADAGLRERLRSASAHAMVAVDARTLNDARPGHAFRRRFRAHPMRLVVMDGGAWHLAIGHHGYVIPSPGVAVLRVFRVLAGGGVAIEDRLTGSGAHEVSLRLPWAPGIRPRTEGGRVVLERAGTDVAVCDVTCQDTEGRPLESDLEHLAETHWPHQGHGLPAITTVARAPPGTIGSFRHEIRPNPANPSPSA